MPIILEYEREQEKREREQDGSALELSLQNDEQRQIITVPFIKIVRDWFGRFSTPSCRNCMNWQSRADGSGYCSCRAAAGLSQMSLSYAKECRLYTEEPF